MIDTMQTLFGLTVPVTDIPLAPELAQALAERLMAAAVSVREGAPSPVAADARDDAGRYLALRRRGALRLPFSLQRTCDETAQAVMRLTLNVPARLPRAERLVA